MPKLMSIFKEESTWVAKGVYGRLPICQGILRDEQGTRPVFVRALVPTNHVSDRR